MSGEDTYWTVTRPETEGLPGLPTWDKTRFLNLLLFNVDSLSTTNDRGPQTHGLDGPVYTRSPCPGDLHVDSSFDVSFRTVPVLGHPPETGGVVPFAVGFRRGTDDPGRDGTPILCTLDFLVSGGGPLSLRVVYERPETCGGISARLERRFCRRTGGCDPVTRVPPKHCRPFYFLTSR